MATWACAAASRRTIRRTSPGTFLNGFYETRPIVYGEQAFGFPKVGQSILNCPDGKIIKLYVDDEPFDLTGAELLRFDRVLDLKNGLYRRDVTWISPSGKRIRLQTTRLVSFVHRHLAVMQYELVAEDGDVDFVIASELINRQPLPVVTVDPRLSEGFVGRVLHPTGTEAAGLRAILSFRTQGLRAEPGLRHGPRAGRPIAPTAPKSSAPTTSPACWSRRAASAASRSV